MDIKKANSDFRIEELVNGKLAKGQFQVDYLPMWQFLDNMDRKLGGLDKVPLKDIFEGIYEFATIQVSLDKADMQSRIDNLNEANLKWFTKASNLEQELEILKTNLLKKQTTNES